MRTTNLQKHSHWISISVLVFLWTPFTLTAADLLEKSDDSRLILVAGGGDVWGDAPAAKAKLLHPFGLAKDKTGNLWLVELAGQRVLKIDAKGNLTVAAGNGKRGYTGDGGPAAAATFADMHALAVHSDGTIFLADTLNHTVRQIDAKTGRISTIAGSGKAGFSGDGGQARDAQFDGVYCIALSPNGKRLYVTDLGNRRIRLIELATGRIETVAGNGQQGVPTDGQPAKDQPLVDPRAAVVDQHGRLYILERSGDALRVVAPDGTIRTVLNGLAGPKHLCIDEDDGVIIADTNNHRIVKFLPDARADKNLIVLAGTGKKGDSGSGGPALQVALNEPHGVFVDDGGTLYIVDSLNSRVFRLERTPLRRK